MRGCLRKSMGVGEYERSISSGSEVEGSDQRVA